MTTFKNAMENRRSYYVLAKESTVPDAEIQKILEAIILNVPSAFNSQTARLALLLGAQHDKLWGEIVMNTLRKIVPAEKFAPTEGKINTFKAAYGTVLFFEDMPVVEALQQKFPSYKDTFPVWSQHTSAMHQFAAWCMLEDAGMGASLQHYNPLIDDEVKKTWGLPKEWRLIAQMPFGKRRDSLKEKEQVKPLSERLRIFK